MSISDHSQASQGPTNQTQSGALRPCSEALDNGPPPPENPERLRVIHNLVRSGGYSIPATVIADCMMERMIVDKRGQGS